MCPTISETALTALAVGLCALAVKIIDDILDKSQDADAGCVNIAAKLGSGSAVYAALFLALAAGLNSQACLPLFIASYVVGMFNDWNSLLPSKLKGWQESLLVMAFGLLVFGWHAMLFSLAFILAVQLADDCIDMRSDRLYGQRNFACRYGLIECWLFSLILLLGACWLNEGLFFPAFTGTAIFYGSILYYQGRYNP